MPALSLLTLLRQLFSVLRPLLEDIEITEAAKAMYNADIAIIACDRGLSEEPKITYINQVCSRRMMPTTKHFREDHVDS